MPGCVRRTVDVGDRADACREAAVLSSLWQRVGVHPRCHAGWRAAEHAATGMSMRHGCAVGSRVACRHWRRPARARRFRGVGRRWAPSGRAVWSTSPSTTSTTCPRRCRRCVVLGARPGGRRARPSEAGDPALEKEAWVSAALLEWGSCGRIVYVDGVPAGFVLYAPPAYVPALRSPSRPRPVSADAVLLMTPASCPEFAGGGPRPDAGPGRGQGPAHARRVRAIEAFGDAQPATGARLRAAGRLPARGRLQDGPSAPALSPAAAGAATTLTWREDVEVALERLLGAVQRPVRPAAVLTAGALRPRPPTRGRPGRRAVAGR